MAVSASPAPKYLIKRHPVDVLSGEERLAHSDQSRNGVIKAFVEIPRGILTEWKAGEPTGVVNGTRHFSSRLPRASRQTSRDPGSSTTFARPKPTHRCRPRSSSSG